MNFPTVQNHLACFKIAKKTFVDNLNTTVWVYSYNKKQKKYTLQPNSLGNRFFKF